MTTIKSYTDLEQSKKLTEIISPESADFCWGIDDETLHYNNSPYPCAWKNYSCKEYYIPCWSLAALLCVLPKTFNYNNHTYQFMYNTRAMFYINVDNYDEDTFCSINKNLVDACYELILKLNELNLL